MGDHFHRGVGSASASRAGSHSSTKRFVSLPELVLQACQNTVEGSLMVSLHTPENKGRVTWHCALPWMGDRRRHMEALWPAWTGRRGLHRRVMHEVGIPFRDELTSVCEPVMAPAGRNMLA